MSDFDKALQVSREVTRPVERARHRVGIGDISPAETAAQLNLSLEEFEAALPRLQRRRFPAADETTGQYCLEAVTRWRRLRYREFFPELTAAAQAEDAAAVFEQNRGKWGGRRGRSVDPLSH